MSAEKDAHKQSDATAGSVSITLQCRDITIVEYLAVHLGCKTVYVTRRRTDEGSVSVFIDHIVHHIHPDRRSTTEAERQIIRSAALSWSDKTTSPVPLNGGGLPFSDFPITFAWLKSLGFREDGFSVSKEDWRIYGSPNGTPPGIWQVRHGLANMNRYRRFETQNDLVELWRLLGVPWSP